MALGRFVSELDEGMTSGEFTHWIAYNKLNPFGQWRDNYHAAMFCQMFGNAHLPKGKPSFKLNDFMYQDIESKRNTETMESLMSFRSLAKRKAKDGES